MFKKIALSLCFTLFLGLLTACSPSEYLRPKDTESTQEKDEKNTTENTEKQNSAIGAPVALPPSFGTQDAITSPSDSTFMPNGLPVLQPMKGINVDELFSEEIKDDNARFDRLEQAVLDMRREFESVKPSIVRLAAVETDIQSLVKEMEVMLQETPADSTNPLPLETEATLQVDQLDPQPVPPNMAQPTPEPETAAASAPQSLAPSSDQVLKLPPQYDPAAPPPPPKEAAKPKPSAPEKTYDGIVAKAFRLGEHGGKVRVVLDTNQKTPFTIDLDNAEKLIVVELPEAKWVGPTTQKFNDSPLIESYSAEATNSGKGTMIVITLKKATEILKQSTLLPDQNPSHRIYFDLKI